MHYHTFPDRGPAPAARGGAIVRHAAALAAIFALGSTPVWGQEARAPDAVPVSSDMAVLDMSKAESPLTVVSGHSKLLRIGQPLGTIVVGDEAIVNATTGAGNSIILTGLMAGSTNLIVLDEANQTLLSTAISVVPIAGPLRSTVTVLKGTTARDRYECRGNNCELLEADEDVAEIPFVLVAAPEGTALSKAQE